MKQLELIKPTAYKNQLKEAIAKLNRIHNTDFVGSGIVLMNSKRGYS